jgi:hypothetical protein
MTEAVSTSTTSVCYDTTRRNINRRLWSLSMSWFFSVPQADVGECLKLGHTASTFQIICNSLFILSSDSIQFELLKMSWNKPYTNCLSVTYCMLAVYMCCPFIHLYIHPSIRPSNHPSLSPFRSIFIQLCSYVFCLRPTCFMLNFRRKHRIRTYWSGFEPTSNESAACLTHLPNTASYSWLHVSLMTSTNKPGFNQVISPGVPLLCGSQKAHTWASRRLLKPVITKAGQLLCK